MEASLCCSVLTMPLATGMPTVMRLVMLWSCTTGNTFENFYPTNHIHMGYMDVMAWKNMLTPSANIQFRPSARDHFEIWYNNFNLASARDNWYRGSQTVDVFSRTNNTAKHIGDELDLTGRACLPMGKSPYKQPTATCGLVTISDSNSGTIPINSGRMFHFG